jgi:GT2 family glycosyltransferase
MNETIDIIILSYAQTNKSRLMTENCVKSLINSEETEVIKFNIIVIESEKSLKPFKYEGTTTIYPETTFGYHRYMNLGLNASFHKSICICNNDLIFYKSWATNILREFEQHNLFSGSPMCGIYHPTIGYKLNSGVYFGYQVRNQLAGWCIFFRRELLELTGRLDENFKFWFADNDYGATLRALNLRHALITSSRVDHLESATLKDQDSQTRWRLTHGESWYWHKKWDYRLGYNWKIID